MPCFFPAATITAWTGIIHSSQKSSVCLCVCVFAQRVMRRWRTEPSRRWSGWRSEPSAAPWWTSCDVTTWTSPRKLWSVFTGGLGMRGLQVCPSNSLSVHLSIRPFDHPYLCPLCTFVHPSICPPIPLCFSVHLSIFLPVLPSTHPYLCALVHPSVFQSACLSIHIPIHTSVPLSPSFHPSICLPISLSVFPSTCLSIHLPTHTSMPLSVHLSFHMHGHPSIHPSAHPYLCAFVYVCLSVHPSAHPYLCASLYFPLSACPSICPPIPLCLSVHLFVTMAGLYVSDCAWNGWTGSYMHYGLWLKKVSDHKLSVVSQFSVSTPVLQSSFPLPTILFSLSQ